MSIVTNKMKTAREDYGSNVKLWFPCNDGSGNIITDLVNGITISDATSATHNEPHAVSILTSANVSVPGLANIRVPKQGALMVMQKVSTSFALTTCILGNSASSAQLVLSGASASMSSSGATYTATGSMAGTVAATNVHCAAMAWNTANLYTYEGINGAAALVDTDALGAGMIAALASGFNLTPYATLNSAFKSDLYGILLLDFSNDGLPSDLLTGINWMRSKWVAGRKEIYPEWNART